MQAIRSRNDRVEGKKKRFNRRKGKKEGREIQSIPRKEPLAVWYRSSELNEEPA